MEKIFRVNYQLNMKWRDSRLRFFNLKNESVLNMVTLNESDAIWYPVAIFQNTLSRDESKVILIAIECEKCWIFNTFQHDSRSKLTILRSGNFFISPKEELRNNHIYSGKDNRISMTRTYNTDFDYTFHMDSYPFDIQQCNMNFILGVLNKNI